jgi:hypothetical protein
MKDHDKKRERIQATKLILELWILVVHLRPFFMILDLNPESPSVGLIPHETAGSRNNRSSSHFPGNGSNGKQHQYMDSTFLYFF